MVARCLRVKRPAAAGAAHRQRTRRLSCVAALALLASALAAAGESQPRIAQEPVTLHFWGIRGDVVAREIAEDFERFHDGTDGRPPIKIVVGQSADINDTDDPQRILTAIAGGDPPDVTRFNRYAVAGMAARGAFQPLQGFIERDLEERPDDPMTLRPEQFFTSCWTDVNYEGEIYALPADTDNRALYYNLDLFDKYADQLIAAGCVSPNDPTKVGPPRNWDQLKRAAEILTERDARGKLQRVGFIPNFGNSWLYMFSWLNGGRFLSPDGRTCTLDAPENVEALVYMTDIYDMMGGAEQVTAFQSGLQFGDIDLFLSGKVAMRIDGDGFLNTIGEQRRDLRFGVVLTPAPEGKRALGWSAGWSWVIPKTAKHQAEAWEFMKYLASRRAYQIRADSVRQLAHSRGGMFIPWFSARRDVTEWAFSHYLYDDPTIEEKFRDAMRVFFDGMAFSEHLPITPAGQLLWTAQVRALDGGIYKRYDKLDVRRNARIALELNTAMVQAELDRLFKPKDYPVISIESVFWAYVGLVFLALGAALWRLRKGERARGCFRRESHAGYAFAAPWFVGFIVFGGGPICFSLLMSLSEYDVLSPPKFVGLHNYVTMLHGDPLFYKSLANTLFMVLGIPLGMVVGLGIALLLSRESRGMAVYRTFFYLPAILPAVAGAILWIWILNPRVGVLNALLATVGIPGPAWLQDPAWSKPALILMNLWGAGAGMIVWLAGLKAIPKHLYEVAELDGAGAFRKFTNITLPMLSPYILFNLIMGVIGAFQMFAQPFIMTQGGPVDSTVLYVYHLFNNAFRYMRMGYASALAWVLFALVLALTILQLRLSRLWVHYESEQ